MKRRFSFLLTAIFLLSVGLCVVTGLSSCENFFNGAELKHEIDDAVAYANAQSCTLYLKSDSASGSFLSEGGKECKVGFTTDIQFTLNQNEYFFVSLEAVSTTDENQSREDCVEFTINKEESDTYRGIYVIGVKVLRYASDILIRPKCMEIPCILSHSPASKSPQFANTPVVINFNIPMEDSETKAEESLFNFENISIFYNGEDMSSYFDDLEFNADKTVLTIRPIGAKIKKFIEEKYLNYLDIDFSFSDAIAATNGGVSFPLKQDSNSNFSVRYNSSVEETPPLRGDFFVTRYDVTLDSAPDLDEKYILPQIVYDVYDYYTFDYVSILMPSTFYIYGKFYDKDSGVQSIEVSESLKDKVDYGDYKETVTVYDWKSADVKFKRDDNGWNSFVLKYTMQESLKEKPGSGVFELAVTVKDACDNAAEKEIFYVNYEEYNNLYYTKVHWTNSSGDLFRVTNAPFSKSEGNPDAYDFDKYYSDLKTIRISDYYDPMLFCVGYRNGGDDKTNFVSAENVNYYCEYTDKDGKKRREPFSAFDPDVMERSLVLDIDRVTDVSFLVTVEYDGMCIGRKTFTFPSKLTFEPYENYSEKGVYAMRKTDNTYCTGILMHEDGTYNIMYPESNAPYSRIYFSEIPEGCTLYLGYYDVCVQSGYPDDTRTNRYYEFNHSTNNYEEVNKSFPEYEQKSGVGIVSPTKLHYTAGLFGEITGPFRRNQDIGSQPSAPSFTHKLSQSQKGYIDVTIQFPLDLWTKFDTILLEYNNNGELNPIRFTEKETSVSDGKICFTFSLEEEMFYYEGKFVQHYFHLTGLKDFMESEQSQNVDIEMTAQQRLEFDSLKPSGVYAWGVDEDRKLVLYFYDNGSGPESVAMHLNGRDLEKEFFNSTDNICSRSISLSSFNMGDNVIEYEVTDKAGNITTGTFICNPLSWGLQTNKCYASFTASTITFASDTLGKLWNKTGSYIKIFKFDESSNTWSVYKTLTKDDVQKSGSTYSLKSNVTLTQNTFYRVYAEIPNDWLYDKMICATSNTGESRYNYVLANGSSKNSVVISSGFSKVLVRLCSTSQPLEVCQNWTADDWDYLGSVYRGHGEAVVSISNSRPTLYDFSEELGYVDRGRCYCLVVHFADGSSVVSQVWKK